MNKNLSDLAAYSAMCNYSDIKSIDCCGYMDVTHSQRVGTRSSPRDYNPTNDALYRQYIPVPLNYSDYSSLGEHDSTDNSCTLATLSKSTNNIITVNVQYESCVDDVLVSGTIVNITARLVHSKFNPEEKCDTVVFDNSTGLFCINHKYTELYDLRTEYDRFQFDLLGLKDHYELICMYMQYHCELIKHLG